MALSIAHFLVDAFGVWIAIGAIFALAFTIVGVSRVDHEARGGSVGFRMLIFPATVALWPLLLVRWMRGGKVVQECNAHRRAARETRT